MPVQNGMLNKMPVPTLRTTRSSSRSSLGIRRGLAEPARAGGSSAKRILAEAMLPSLAVVVASILEELHPHLVPPRAKLGALSTGISAGSCDASLASGGRQRSPFLAVDFFGRSTTALGRTA
jgi:hypothetical protein